MSAPAAIEAHATPLPERPYRAEEVAHLLGVAVPTIYEHARREPEKWGVIRVGRAVRFRRPRVDALVRGE